MSEVCAILKENNCDDWEGNTGEYSVRGWQYIPLPYTVQGEVFRWVRAPLSQTTELWFKLHKQLQIFFPLFLPFFLPFPNFFQ